MLGIQNKDYVIKHSKVHGELLIKEIDYDTAKWMIIDNHYSKKWNTAFGKINYGIFRDDKLLGVAVYGNLMNPNSAYKLIDSGKVIELNRLWIDDELGHNTETIMLSATFTLLKNNTEYELVQSFADGRLGVGTIYKASNFGYYGYEKSLFYESKLDSETYHQAPFDNTARPKGFLLLNDKRLKGELKAFYVKTYRYLYPLKKKLKIKLESEKYPSYEKGVEYVNIEWQIGVLCRLHLMYKEIEYDQGVELTCSKLRELYDDETVEQELTKQKENEYYIEFRDNYDDKLWLKAKLENTLDEQLSLF